MRQNGREDQLRTRGQSGGAAHHLPGSRRRGFRNVLDSRPKARLDDRTRLKRMVSKSCLIMKLRSQRDASLRSGGMLQPGTLRCGARHLERSSRASGRWPGGGYLGQDRC